MDDVLTDVAKVLNVYNGPDPDNATMSDVVLDAADALNLYHSHATMNDEIEGVKDGRIKKAHPIWGISMCAIPFLPMLITCPLLALFLIGKRSTRIKVLGVILALILSLPFSAVATPLYILTHSWKKVGT